MVKHVHYAVCSKGHRRCTPDLRSRCASRVWWWLSDSWRSMCPLVWPQTGGIQGVTLAYICIPDTRRVQVAVLHEDTWETITAKIVCMTPIYHLFAPSDAQHCHPFSCLFWSNQMEEEKEEFSEVEAFRKNLLLKWHFECKCHQETIVKIFTLQKIIIWIKLNLFLMQHRENIKQIAMCVLNTGSQICKKCFIIKCFCKLSPSVYGAFKWSILSSMASLAAASCFLWQLALQKITECHTLTKRLM